MRRRRPARPNRRPSCRAACTCLQRHLRIRSGPRARAQTLLAAGELITMPGMTGPVSCHATALLAATDPAQVAWTIVALLAMLFGGFVVVVLIHRYARRMTAQTTQQEPFTLDQLRQLHQRGELSDEQYERARDRMVERLKAPPPEPPPRER